MTITNLLVACFLGLVAGVLSFSFVEALKYFDLLRLQHPYLVLFIPWAALLFAVIKKQTLFFPKTIKELHEMTKPDLSLWNSKMPFFHYLGALISHFVGASVGREGVLVLTMTGLSHWLNLSLPYWGPVAAAIGFSAIIGLPWIGVIFLLEMFSTQLSQKLWVVIGSWVAYLTLKAWSFQHLLSELTIPDVSFGRRFIFVIFLAMIMGTFSKYYKLIYNKAFYFFRKQSLVFTFMASAGLAALLWLPLLRDLQSLGLNILTQAVSLQLPQTGFYLILLKLLMTVLFLSLGFYGGDFVPLVVCGAGLGYSMAGFFGETPLFGVAIGAFGLFAGVTRLKWTAFFMALAVMGWSFAIWIYLFLSFILFLAENESTYKNPDEKPFNFMSFQSFQFPRHFS